MGELSHYVPVVGAGLAFGAVVYFFCQFVTLPLKIPSAHWSSRFTPAWILWQRWHGRELQKVTEAHRKLGPLVILGPRDLSVGCYQDGIRTIYGGGFDKPGYYDFFNYYG